MNKSRLALLLLLLVISIQINAQGNSRDTDKERKIEYRLKNIDPALVETFKAGTVAMDAGNYALADSLYSIVYQNAPTFDPVIRRLGIVRFQSGRAEEGIDLCTKAVSIDRTAYNLLSLATCYFYRGSGESNSIIDIRKARELLKEAETLPDGDDFDIAALRGQIALQENDIIDFRRITQRLMDKYPDEMVSHYYAAILATEDQKWTKAKGEILVAQKLGLAEEEVTRFLDSGVENRATTGLFIRAFIWITGFWILGLLLLFLIGKYLSNSTMRSLEKQKGADEVSGKEQSLRSVYRQLINVGGVYYYISLPIILVLVLALVAGLFYAFLLLGRIPIKLMLILAVGACFTIYGMVRSLLVKIKYTDPGRELREEEAPGLFKLTAEVAETIGTRPIDEIRITPTTDMAVYEKGSWREKLQDKARRILILGTGVLKDFKKDEFRAVLAHEYGHFSHRDTAGGEVALRVRNDIINYFLALQSAGQNVWWNIAFQFLRLYNSVFVRISHGASRLQEVLADRVAAKTYGKTAFQNGLTYVIKRDIEFIHYANSEIEEAKKSKRPFNNLYNLTGDSNNTVEEELKKALNAKTSEDDTHPSPVDRFRYVDGINSEAVTKDQTCVHELFTDWEALTKEMTEQIEKQVN